MDLHRHGLALHANSVVNRYLEQTGDHAGLAALPLFLSCRAAVRAHVAVAAADATGDVSRLEEAQALLRHALAYLSLPIPRLVAIGGVSGTGKTTLARRIAPFLGAAPGALVIRSDVIRKQLMGAGETARLPESAYLPEVTAKVYARLAEISAVVLKAGYVAIADAVFGRSEEQELIAGIAERARVPFSGIWLDGPTDILEQRVAARRGDASDATAHVLRAQLGFVTKPEGWRTIHVSLPREEIAAQAMKLLAVKPLLKSRTK
jgi:predicted kinase